MCFYTIRAVWLPNLGLSFVHTKKAAEIHEMQQPSDIMALFDSKWIYKNDLGVIVSQEYPISVFHTKSNYNIVFIMFLLYNAIPNISKRHVLLCSFPIDFFLKNDFADPHIAISIRSWNIMMLWFN